MIHIGQLCLKRKKLVAVSAVFPLLKLTAIIGVKRYFASDLVALRDCCSLGGLGIVKWDICCVSEAAGDFEFGFKDLE